MSKKRNISNKQDLKLQVLWSLTVLGILVVLWLSIARKAKSTIEKINIDIVALEGKRNLISKKYVFTKCQKHLGYDIRSSRVKDLDLRELELILDRDKRIKDAQVYVDSKQNVHFQIIQRNPIVRIQSKETAYYMGSEGEYIPLAKGATVRVPVVTGEVAKYDSKLLVTKEDNVLKDIYSISKYIYEDEFLSSLIEQIDIDRHRNITLIPKIGKQELVFGKAEKLEERFFNLKQFYKKGMPKVGWRKFDQLVLNWDGQVVGRKTKNRN